MSKRGRGQSRAPAAGSDPEVSDETPDADLTGGADDTSLEQVDDTTDGEQSTNGESDPEVSDETPDADLTGGAARPARLLFKHCVTLKTRRFQRHQTVPGDVLDVAELEPETVAEMLAKDWAELLDDGSAVGA